jgi:anti-sigma B factor antagonist
MSNIVNIIQPSGILDGTKANEFRQEVNESLKKDADIILVDLKDVTFMDSSGLGALVLSLKAVRDAKGKMFLCSFNDQIKMLFELTSMDRVFEIFSNREEFEQKVLLQYDREKT